MTTVLLEGRPNYLLSCCGMVAMPHAPCVGKNTFLVAAEHSCNIVTQTARAVAAVPGGGGKKQSPAESGTRWRRGRLGWG